MSKNRHLKNRNRRLRREIEHLTAIGKLFIPRPNEMSGYDDPNCDQFIKRTIEAAHTFWKRYGDAKAKKKAAIEKEKTPPIADKI